MMEAYDFWRKLHYLRNEDYKTNEEQLANVCAAIEADREAARAAAPALMEEGEKAGRRKATKQIADWLREWGEDHLANQIEEGAPFQ
jgi:hypothetical protein